MTNSKSQIGNIMRKIDSDRKLWYCSFHFPDKPKWENLTKKNQRLCVIKTCRLVATKIDETPWSHTVLIEMYGESAYR